jgi:uncharacterized SAM-binding protein YcdF (DUF218 family)
VKRKLWIAAALLIFAALVFHTSIFRAMGSYLVRGQDPAHADLIVVLAGDSHGNRILKGAELVRQGFAPKALIDGPSGQYGMHESDLAIPFAVRAGFPESYFVPLPMDAHSTEEEAHVVQQELRRLGAHRVLLVTSNYHTRRAAGFFRRVDPEHEFIVIAAPDVAFSPEDWWHNREGRKTFLIEWLKTVAAWFGI